MPRNATDYQITLTAAELSLVVKALEFLCDEMQDDMVFAHEIGATRGDAEDLIEKLQLEQSK